MLNNSIEKVFIYNGSKFVLASHKSTWAQKFHFLCQTFVLKVSRAQRRAQKYVSSKPKQTI